MLSKKDTAALGMMVFALFLGAGNIIFPPSAGYLAGHNWFESAMGFMLTGVGLPFLTLLVVAGLGKGEALSKDLPPSASTAFWVALYLIIGPTFAMPRVTNVAYEMGWLAFGMPPSTWMHFGFSLFFNAVGLFFMLKPGSLINTVGKVMTPVLLCLLVAVAAGVLLNPLSSISESQAAYQDHAFSQGLVSGYQTMDVLGAMAFGGLVARTLAMKGITRGKTVSMITLKAGALSALLLASLYFCLFYLGATSGAVGQGASNGGQIFSQYVNALFGTFGTVVMAGIILLACLTTLVGVTSATADYFSETWSKLSYTRCLIVCSLATAVVSNFGLDVLITVTVPVLFLIYPSAVTLVLLQLARPWIKDVKLVYAATLGLVGIMSVADAVNVAGFMPSALQSFFQTFPMFDQSMAWVLPGILAFVCSNAYLFVRKTSPARS